MNRETYEEIKKRIRANYDTDLAHLEALEPHFGVFNPRRDKIMGKLNPINDFLPSPKALVKPQRAEMVVLNRIPPNGTNGSQIEPKYVKKLVPCEVKNCDKKANPNRACPACSKKICYRHMRGKVCHECNVMGEK